MNFCSCENGIFNDVTITSSLRSVVHVLMGNFTISHGLSKNCKMSKFIKVTAKILSVPFFLGHSVVCRVGR